ncbi:MAG: hypothetical protein RQ856_00730 [Candidatus Izemoplasmatales bacterium]|nr:hypothetical protein [Candidatus Izemoplasmatales bacterium]
MKKIFILFLMLFALVGFSACNGGRSNLEISYDEQIAFPINLTIEGDVLSWDAVTDATGYYVYVDGEEVDSVRTNSFNFAKLEGSRIIFTVVTKAPRGMQDSVQSNSIAYMQNKDAEISSMMSAIEANNLPFREEFAEELVNKGMLATEFEDMMQAMEEFSEDITTVDSINAAYLAIKDMMGSVENPEALISALVKYTLPEQIAEQIQYNQIQIDEYQYYIDDGFDSWSGYYQDEIDRLMEENEALEALQEQLSSSHDQVVKSILITIEYLMKVEEMITQDLITNITNLTETNTLADLNVSEIVLVKEEMVNILNETMPTQSEFILVINTLYSFSDIVAEMENVDLGTAVYPEKIAATMLMTFEAYIRFLDNLDEEFFTELKAIGANNDSEIMIQAEIAILGIIYFDDFLEDNEALIDEIEEIFTDEEKEVMFNDYIASIEDAANEQAFTSIDLSFITFDKMMALQVIFEDAFNEFLDAFVVSDGQILRAVAEIAIYEKEFRDSDYYDSDYTEYNFNSTILGLNIANETVYLLNSVVSERTEEEFEEVRGFFIDFIATYVPTMLMSDMGLTFTEVQGMVTEFENFMNNTTTEQYDQVQNIFAFLDEEDIFLDYTTLYEDTYENNLEDLDLESNYFNMIFIINVYDDYMITGNRDDVDAIIAAVAVMLGSSAFSNLDAEEYPEVMTELLDYLDTITDEVSGMVYTNMPSSQTDRLDDIAIEIQNIILQTPTA